MRIATWLLVVLLLVSGVGSTWALSEDAEPSAATIAQEIVETPVHETLSMQENTENMPMVPPVETPEVLETPPPPPPTLTPTQAAEVPAIVPETTQAPTEALPMDTASPVALTGNILISILEKGPFQYGDRITLRCHVEGYENTELTYQWQCSAPGAAWEDIPGETSQTYAVTLTAENAALNYRAAVYIIPISEP